MKLTFLAATVPLTKRFTMTPDGLDKQSYPRIARFTNHRVDVANLAQLATTLHEHAQLGHCLLKGNTIKDLDNASRRGSTESNEPTEWICLDVDGLKGATIDAFIKAMRLDDISYVLQYSASYGIENRKLRAHVFLQLAEPRTPSDLKLWLTARNFDVPLLMRNVTLNATHDGLHYGLDITTCQNDKLLYIAPPELIGVPDPMAHKSRISYVARQHATFNLHPSNIPDAETNRTARSRKIATLRAEAHLPERSFSVERSGAHEIVINPEVAQITGMRRNGDFVALNINGGDSWAYYHPIKHDALIHNFKGEPVYRTKEIFPEYWAALHPEDTTPVVIAPNEGDIEYIAFCDRETSTYWRGTYKPRTQELRVKPAGTLTILKDFMKSHGMPLEGFIHEGRVHYDPNNHVRWDSTTRTLNTFIPSKYMLATRTHRSAPPPTILGVLYHALGNDEAVTRRFVNWLAFIVQRRVRTSTAWILHGTQGTGKGVIFDHILEPLLGASNVKKLTQHNIEGETNDFLKTSLLIFVDEMEHAALRNSASIMAKLKNWITEKTVQVREMYKGNYTAPNRANFIFASNRPDPVSVDREDRRFNVARYQPVPLQINQHQINSIESELQHFYDYLHEHAIDLEDVRTPIRTDDREQMIGLTETSLQSAINHLKKGNWRWMIEQLPDDNRWENDPLTRHRTEAYLATIQDLIERTEPDTGRVKIPRDELRRIFEYSCGNMPVTPNKFTSMLRKNQLNLEGMRIGDNVMRGMYVTWTDPAAVKASISLFGKPSSPSTKKPNHLSIVKT